MLNNVGYLISIIVVGLRRDGNEKPAGEGEIIFPSSFWADDEEGISDCV